MSLSACVCRLGSFILRCIQSLAASHRISQGQSTVSMPLRFLTILPYSWSLVNQDVQP